jgi:hypothetical protein
MVLPITGALPLNEADSLNKIALSFSLTLLLAASVMPAQATQGDFDPTEFTFANGIFCDVKERLCREDRYYGEGGKRTGAVSRKYTELLFGH